VPPAELRELSLAFVLRNIHGLACWYIDSRIPLRGADFPYPARPTPRPIRTCFQARCVSMRGRRRSASMRNTWRCRCGRDEKALQQMLQRALPITVLQYRRDRLAGAAGAASAGRAFRSRRTARPAWPRCCMCRPARCTGS
jgi:hypothetical protein